MQQKLFAFVGGLVLTSVVLVSCTTTEVKVVKAGSTAQTMTNSAPHALSLTQYDIAITRKLVSCRPLTIKVSAEATANVVKDPQERYFIDLASAGNLFKTSEMKVEYYAGERLKSINATVEDQSAQALAATLGGVAQLAKFSASKSAFAPSEDDCPSRLRNAILAKTQVDDLTRQTAKARSEYDQLRAAMAEEGDPEDGAAHDAFVSAAVKLRKLRNDLADATTAQEDADKKVTQKVARKWPNDSNTFEGVDELPTSVFDAWSVGTGADAKERSRATVVLKLQALDVATGQYVAGRSLKTTGKGLPYRSPRPGRLLIETVDGKAAGEARGPIAQIGDLLYFRIVNKPLQNASFGLGLSETGELSMVSYAQKAAPARAAAEAFKGTAEQVVTINETLATGATKRLQQELAELKVKKETIDAQAALAPSDKKLLLDDLNSEQSIKKAKLEILKTDAALAAFPAT